MSNPYLEAMMKEAGLLPKPRLLVQDLLERAKIGAPREAATLPMYKQSAAAAEAAEAVAGAAKKEGPGIVGSVVNAGYNTARGLVRAPVNYAQALFGSNVNREIMRHAEMAGKFSTPAQRFAFEQQLSGLSDEKKLKFTQDNLGPEAVKSIKNAMGSRAATRAVTGAAAGAAVMSHVSGQRNQGQY